MLEDYAKQHGFSNPQHYTDDGYSGGNFERPSWQRLLADIEAGRVTAVLAKDMSRIGRDYLQTGFYTEVFFKQKGVRFIAIGNGIDSQDQSSGEFAPFLNIMNEWYLRDCSRKQLAAYQTRGKSGKRTTNVAIYGYKKDPNDKHHWLIDEDAAAIVRRMFKLSIEGYGVQQIANIFRDEKIERPSYYLGSRGMGVHPRTYVKDRPYDWTGTSVSQLLEKPEYMGHTVNFRTRKMSYKDRYPVVLPKEDWLIFKNTHEAIVDEETWMLAQKVRRTVRRTDTTGFANPLTGLVFCADCGKRMYNHKGRKNPKKPDGGRDPISGLYPFDNYECSTYNMSCLRSEKECCLHRIPTKNLHELILDTIKTVSEYALANKAEFTRKVHEASKLRQTENTKELRLKINKAKKRCAELDLLIKRLYESYATGKLSEKRFEMLSGEYETEQAELEALTASEQKLLETYEENNHNIEMFLSIARKYTDFTVLTTPMINEFIDKIIVHAPDKSSGERVQEVEIILNFIGKFEIPAVELTAEEAAELERERQLREYRRTKVKEHRERKKQKTA